MVFDMILPQVYHEIRMNLKKGLVLVFGFVWLFVGSSPVWARKKLVRPAPSPSLYQYGAWVKPRLRADRQALLLMLGGMNYADSLDYSLVYNSGSVSQGVQGSYDPSLGNTQKELVFGTCSGTDCTYHQDISEMFLTVSIGLKDGRTLSQRYQVNP
jgi:hypothetical protein